MSNESITYAVQTTGLGKRYGSFWALQDSTIAIPEGRVSALVGPNGAGKTTILKLLAGLSTPTTGSAIINGKTPKQSEDFLAEVGYLAQEIPLYTSMTAADHIKLGAHLNRRWDVALITTRLQNLGIPLGRPLAKLSGGQRAQVALAMALAKKPRLLLLDEPVAALDPLARNDFLTSLALAAAEGGLTVLMSSHLLADLERICDHIIIVAAGKTQQCADIETVLKSHRLLVGKRQDTQTLPAGFVVVSESHTPRQSMLLVNNPSGIFTVPGWEVHKVTIEDVVLAYMGQAIQHNARGEA